MSSELFDFVERLERLAGEAPQEEWQCFSGGGYISIGVNHPCEVVGKRLGSIVSEESRAKPDARRFLHIAANDPPTVLLLCAVIRELIEALTWGGSATERVEFAWKRAKGLADTPTIKEKGKNNV